jgi:hypothetical protein
MGAVPGRHSIEARKGSMTKVGTVHSPRRTHRRWRAVALGLSAVVAVLLAACSSGTSTVGSAGGSNAAVVEAPDFTLQGCTYVLDSTVPAAEPQGVKPPFPSFSPDQSATDATDEIKAHGGTAMVDSVTLPAGTTLRSGPDTGQSAVGTVPAGHSILAAEPVVWTDHTGAAWLAFFLSCGGEHLYWVSVSELTHQNAAAGKQVAAEIDALRKAPSYVTSGQASLLPIHVTAQEHLAFVDPKVTFIVGRGELIGVPT